MTTRKLRDIKPFNAAQADADAQISAERFAYLVARRDQLLDRMRLGSLALNGASFIALLGALGGEGGAAKWLGYTPHSALFSACAFVAGIVCAAISTLIDANRQTVEASDAFARMLSARSLRAAFDLDASMANEQEVRRLLSEHGALPLVDFQFSVTATALQNASAGAWLAGVAFPLAATLGY